MEAGLQLSQSQVQRMEQTLAPQMLQSLKILQVPLLDLQAMVRSEMEQNPTLEREVPDIEQTTDFDAAAREELREKQEIGELNDLAEWDDAFRSNREIRSSQDDDERHQFMMDSIQETISLQDHLLEQLALTDLDRHERGIAEVLIGSIDDDGYLRMDLDGIMGSTPEFPEELFERIIHVIQEFDPVGVGARDLRECLLLQLQHQGKGNSLEATLVRDHLDQLAAHRYELIAKEMRLPIETIRRLSQTIEKLNPNPGRNVSSERTEYAIPEVTVEKRDGHWIVLPNDTPYPRLFISRKYLELLKDPTTPMDTRAYIREKIAKSKFFIRSIDQRKETIHRIAQEIVSRQEGYLEEGVAALKPMTMKEVADALTVHETTISRACSGKYIQTSQGTVEFRFLFSTGIAQADGQMISNTSIRYAVDSIIRTESKRNPLSDQRIADELAKQGIHIARRTVAKYREQLKILPARLRRR